MNEFELIDAFVAAFDVPAPPAGPGDDCAVLSPSRHATCVTTDALVEGVHFTRPEFTCEDVGHKALAVNLSDVAAMGAQPKWMVCALGLPKGFRTEELKSIARGMSALARVHRVALVGGNVTASSELTLTLTVGGEIALGKRAMLRSGGRAGDVLYVSGFLGDAAAGLQCLRRRRRSEFSRLVEAQRRPSPHIAWGAVAADFASAGIDVSDGLAQDLSHLMEASGVGADIASQALPLSPSLRRFVRHPEEAQQRVVPHSGGSTLLALSGTPFTPSLSRGPNSTDLRPAQQLALSGGEDYVILVAVPQRKTGSFEARMKACGFSAFRIGQLSAHRGLRVDGRNFHGRAGFQHFR